MGRRFLYTWRFPPCRRVWEHYAPNLMGFAPRHVQIFVAVLTGTDIAYPTLTQDLDPDGIWEIPLWKWETPNGAADLTGVTFIDMRDWSNLPRVLAGTLTNNSGADVPTAIVRS